MLRPVRLPDTQQEVEYGSDSPVVPCEACGTTGPTHLMINVMIVIGSPGHPSLSAFQCSQTEHWACSPTCWRAVAHACIDEHMCELLAHHHSTLTIQGDSHE